MSRSVRFASGDSRSMQRSRDSNGSIEVSHTIIHDENGTAKVSPNKPGDEPLMCDDLESGTNDTHDVSE